MSETEKPRKEDRRVRRTKKILTAALTELLQEKQINEITVTELTELADMNRGTFYLYYRDIYDMLDSIEEEMFQSLNTIIEMNPADAAETLRVLENLFRFVEEQQALCRVLLSPRGDMNFLHRLNNVVREKLMAWAPRTDDPEAQAVFNYLYQFSVFGLAGIIRSWVGDGCRESPEQMARMVEQLIAQGDPAEWFDRATASVRGGTGV